MKMALSAGSISLHGGGRKVGGGVRDLPNKLSNVKKHFVKYVGK